MTLAPIVLFVYNRIEHTKKTIEALQKNTLANQSELFIYSDASKDDVNDKKVKIIRDYIKTIKGFKKIIITERDINFGLAKSVMQGVSHVVNKFEKVIVLEDDIETTPYFLKFMNDALTFYKDDKRIMSISGYRYPFQIPKNYNKDVFLFYRTSSWGWATWKDEWESVDFNISKEHEIFKDKSLQKKFNRGGEDLYGMLIEQMEGRINSWAIRFALSHAMNDKFGLLPIKSLVQNIGFDLSGTHCEASDEFNVILDPDFSPKLDEVNLDLEIVKNLQKTFSTSFFKKIKYNIKKIIK
mgnify:CR=1 FL=1